MGETSANQTIALTEYFLAHYNIAPDRIYLHGISGGGETGSVVMGKRPELYEQQGLTQDEIDQLVVLDVKPRSYFTERSFRDQHAGRQAFAHDEEIMGWLFGSHGVGPTICSGFKRGVLAMGGTNAFTFADNERDGNLSCRDREGYAHDGTAANEYAHNAPRFF